MKNIITISKEGVTTTNLIRNCPNCNVSMNLQPVNTSSRDQTGDDSNSVWICPNIECMNTIYNKETIKELSIV